MRARSQRNSNRNASTLHTTCTIATCIQLHSLLKAGVPEADTRPKLNGRGFKKQIQFSHTEGGEVDIKNILKLDGELHREILINDMSGKMFPFNPQKMFQNQNSQQIHSTWFSIKEDVRAGVPNGLSLVTVQHDATITFGSQFNVHAYPYDKHIFKLKLNARWFPIDWSPKGKKLKWTIFERPPVQVMGEKGITADGKPCAVPKCCTGVDETGKPKKKVRHEIDPALDGFAKQQIPRELTYHPTQYPAIDDLDEITHGDFNQCPSWVYRAKDGVYLMMRFERDPAFFIANVCLPVFLICACSLSSFLIDDEDPLYEAAAITLTTLLTLIGMKYVTLALIPKCSYMTFADKYMVFAMFTNVLVLGVNCMTHGAFSRVVNSTNVNGSITEHVDEKTISMATQESFRGDNKVVIGFIIAFVWGLPNVFMILDAILEWKFDRKHERGIFMRYWRAKWEDVAAQTFNKTKDGVEGPGEYVSILAANRIC